MLYWFDLYLYMHPDVSVWSLPAHEPCYIGLIFAFICNLPKSICPFPMYEPWSLPVYKIVVYHFIPYLYIRLCSINLVFAYASYSHKIGPLPIYMIVPSCLLSACTYSAMSYMFLFHFQLISNAYLPFSISHLLSPIHFVLLITPHLCSFYYCTYCYHISYTRYFTCHCHFMPSLLILTFMFIPLHD